MKQGQVTNIRMDASAIITMLIVAIAGAAMLSYKILNAAPCVDFTITPYAQNYYTGENIKFTAKIPSYSSLEWSYGDGAQEISNAAIAYHSFKTPGEYTIALTASKSCTQFVTINITTAPIIIDSTHIPKFTWPSTATVGVPVSFQDHTKDATQWQWRFGETASIDATGSNPTYVYKKPGLKTISLMVNNDPTRLASVQIFVNDIKRASNGSSGSGGGNSIIVVNRPQSQPLDSAKRQPQPNTPPQIAQINQPPANNSPNITNIRRAPEVTRQQFEQMLRDVADNSLSIQFFSKYMEDISSTPVTVNSKLETFGDFYKELASLKNSSKIKTLNVQMTKDGKTNYIKRLDVELKKKSGLFGL